jgi:hypothetical protein
MRERLERLANEVLTHGLSGKPMRAKLAEIIDREDLTPNEIRRISERANRDLQSELFKVAEDKRFKYELIDPATLVSDARKHAAASLRRTADEAKIAAAIDEAGGDPFAAPDLHSDHLNRLSLLREPRDPHLTADLEFAGIRAKLAELERIRQDYEVLKTSARATEIESLDSAEQHAQRAADRAADMMLGSGIKLPDLYMALKAAVSGAGADEATRKSVDPLMLLILSKLKARGIPNAQMGFRFRGCPCELEALDSADLLALCKRTAGESVMPAREGDITVETQKRAQMYLKVVQDAQEKVPGHPYEEADRFLGTRPSVAEAGLAPVYMDDANTNNIPARGIKVVDGDNEFVIAIRDLMGDQTRLVRSHSAWEYLGLKLKQIEEAMRQLQGAADRAKTANPIAAAAPIAARGLLALGKKLVTSPMGQQAAFMGGMSLLNRQPQPRPQGTPTSAVPPP